MDQSRTDELLNLYAAMLDMDSAPMRRVAVWELGRLGDARGADVLIRAATGDDDWECRHYAIMALANVGQPAHAAQLRELIADGYLSPDSTGPAGPPPETLRDHLLEDLDYVVKCATGEAPRPSDDEGRHGEWWRGES